MRYIRVLVFLSLLSLLLASQLPSFSKARVVQATQVHPRSVDLRANRDLFRVALPSRPVARYPQPHPHPVHIAPTLTPTPTASVKKTFTHRESASEGFRTPSAPVVKTVTTPTGGPATSVWYRLAACESGGNWADDTGNGFYGGLQFVKSTWVDNGGLRFASNANFATAAQQIQIAEYVLSRSSWRQQWPACSKKLGLW